jgi:hypothetical protein
MTTRIPGILALLALVGLALLLTLRFLGDRVPSGGEVAGVIDGLCEASALLPWEGGFLVADNEAEEHLLVLDASMRPKAPLELGVRVEDVEALARLPEGLLVVGSQGANREGKARPERERVLLLGSPPIRPDLSNCAPCEAARSFPPKEGGLSVEGAAWWAGSLWFGLRSPLVDAQALLLRMEGDPAAELRVSETLRLDLRGRGIRDLAPDGEALLVLAGPSDRGDAPHALYRLAAPGARPVALPVALPPSTEGIARLDAARLVYVTDGDGEPGRPCARPARWGEVPLP